MEKTLKVRSLEELKRLAETVAPLLFPGAVIGLTGELGSGKTTFTKYLAKAMGVTDNVNSPTFTILKIYQGRLPFYHMDVYRLEGIGYDFELDEFIYGTGVSVIEWEEYIRDMLPDEILEIAFEFVDDTTRNIRLRGRGKYEEIVKAARD